MEEKRCPTCNSINDAASSADNDDAIPQEGDISLCLYCGSINQFVGPNLDIEPMPDEVLMDIKENDRETYDQLMEYVIHIKGNMAEIRSKTKGWKTGDLDY